RGFDRFFGLIGSVRSYFDPPTLTSDNEPSRAGEDFYLTDALTKWAVGCLASHARKSEPFFLYAAYTAPHWPLHVPPDIAGSGEKYKQGWDEFRKRRHEKQTKLGVVDARWRLSPRDAGAPAWSTARDKQWQAKRMAVYAAMVESLDQGVGRIME